MKYNISKLVECGQSSAQGKFVAFCKYISAYKEKGNLKVNNIGLQLRKKTAN